MDQPTTTPRGAAPATASPTATHPYLTAPFRLEWRPSDRVHDLGQLEATLDALVRCGVRAWWYSAAAKGSYPLFPSKHLPFRDDPNHELLPWLTDACHERGITIMSWEYLNTAPLLTEQHPEYRLKYLGHDTPASERERHFVCYNSPYGERLKHYVYEVLTELGFDGMWFDGCYMFGEGQSGKYACHCDYCRAKYQTETGRQMPDRVCPDDPAFRELVRWRYRDFSDYLRGLADHVERHTEGKLIAFNHFYRFHHGWEGGLPLRQLPMPGTWAAEIDGCHQQLLLLHKLLREVNHDDQPTEVWTPVLDGVYAHYPNRPNPEPASLVHFGQTSAAAGGFASMGIGMNGVTDYEHTLRAITDTINPISPYVGGTPLHTIGLVASANTLDFGHDQPVPGWKAIHGLHNLLGALHWPTGVLLDDMLVTDTLARYDVIVLPDVRCLSDVAGEALAGYVEAGGKLISIGDTGTLDEHGKVRARGVLDALCGVRQRVTDEAPAIIQANADWLCAQDLPPRYMISGDGQLVDAEDDADVLARGEAQFRKKFWEGQRGPQRTDGAALIMRQHGSGHAFYLSQNIGIGYSENPNRRSRRLIELLLQKHVSRPFEMDAPANVWVEPWQQDGRLTLHLLNTPSAMLHLRGQSRHDQMPLRPEDITPTGPVRVSVPGTWADAHSPTHPETLTVERTTHGLAVAFDQMDHHAVVVLNAT